MFPLILLWLSCGIVVLVMLTAQNQPKLLDWFYIKGAIFVILLGPLAFLLLIDD